MDKKQIGKVAIYILAAVIIVGFALTMVGVLPESFIWPLRIVVLVAGVALLLYANHMTKSGPKKRGGSTAPKK